MPYLTGDTGVNGYVPGAGRQRQHLARWREAFLESGLAGLRSKKTDQRDEAIANLQRKLGAITMENDLLYEKIHKMEEGLPLARRRSKK